MLGVVVPDRTFLGCPAHRPGCTLNQPRGFQVLLIHHGDVSRLSTIPFVISLPLAWHELQASGRSGVHARAASLEEAKSVSTNGVVSDGQEALDFDELTGLIKYG